MDEKQWREENASLDAANETTVQVVQGVVQPPKKPFQLKYLLWAGLSLFFLATVVVTIFWLRQKAINESDLKKDNPVKIQDVDTSGVADLPSQIDNNTTDKVVINGQLQANHGVVLSPSSQPDGPSLGQLYFDKNTNQINYFSGSGFVPFASQVDLSVLQNQITSLSNTFSGFTSGSFARVASLQALAGDLTLLGSGGLSISTNGSSISLNLPQNLTTTSTPQFSGLLTNAITPNSTLTVGGFDQQFNLQGSSSSSIAVMSGASNTTLNFATPTANNTITFADESGEVCTTAGSFNCLVVYSPASVSNAYIQFAPVSAQIDTNTNPASSTIYVAKDNDSGNIIRIQGTGTTNPITSDVFVIQGNGDAYFRSLNASTTAFQVQDTNNNTVFNVDTTYAPYQNLMISGVSAAYHDFESDTPGLIPSGWEQYGPSPADVVTSGATAKYGSQSMLVTTYAQKNDGAAYSVPNGGLAPNTSYVLTMWVKATSTTIINDLVLGHRDNSNTILGNLDYDCPVPKSTANLFGAPKWVYMVCTFTTNSVAPVLPSESKIYIRRTNSALDAGASFYVDSIQLYAPTGNQVTLGNPDPLNNTISRLSFAYDGGNTVTLQPLLGTESSGQYLISIPQETGVLCTTAASSDCSIANDGKFLSKTIKDTTKITVTSGFLYGFTNIDVGGVGGVLSLDNKTNTGTALKVNSQSVDVDSTSINTTSGSTNRLKVYTTGKIGINTGSHNPSTDAFGDISFGGGSGVTRTINVLDSTGSETNGGTLKLQSGSANGTSNGGAVEIQAGNAIDVGGVGSGGQVRIYAGQKGAQGVGAGTNGTVLIRGGGSTIIQPWNDNNTAFQVKNTAGTAYLTVDTTASGVITLNGDTTLASGNNLTVTSGTFATSGTVNINVGAGGNQTNIGTSSTSGQISIGGGSTPLLISSTNFDVSTAGALSGITGYTQASGNFVQNGAGTFGTGTGAVSLNGATSVTGTNTFNVGTGTSTFTGGNITQTGSGTFGTGSGAVSLNGATTVTGVNTFTTGTGAVSLNGDTTIASGKTLTVTSGALTSSGGLISLNTSGASNTDIGNATGTLSLTSSAFNLNTSGAVTGVTTLDTSSTINLQTISATANFTGTVAVATSLTTPSILSAGAFSLTPGGVATIGSTGQSLILQGNATTSLSATDGGFTSTLAFATPTANHTISIPDIGVGLTDTICLLSLGNCAGSGAGVTSAVGGTTGVFSKFTTAQNIENSTLSESGSVITASGSLVIQGSGGLTVGTASTNDGKLVFNNSANANTVTLQSGATGGTNPVFTLPIADGSPNQCLKTDGFGVLSFVNCVGGGGGASAVTDLNTFINSVSIVGTANQITIGNSLNVITLSTPQNIATSSDVTFNTITSTGLATSLGLTAGAGLIQGTGGLTIEGTSQINTSGTANTSIGNVTGTFAVTSAGLNVTSAGALSGITTISTSSTINSQTISSTANFTGTLTVQGANSLTLGTASTNTGAILFQGSGSANTLTLQGPASPSTNTLTLPNETGTLCSTGSVCSGYASSATSFIQGGNSFTAVAVLGTIDAYDLQLKTSNTPRVTINSTTGNVNFTGDLVVVGEDITGGYNLRLLGADTVGAPVGVGGSVVIKGGNTDNIGANFNSDGGDVTVSGGDANATNGGKSGVLTLQSGLPGYGGFDLNRSRIILDGGLRDFFEVRPTQASSVSINAGNSFLNSGSAGNVSITAGNISAGMTETQAAGNLILSAGSATGVLASNDGSVGGNVAIVAGGGGWTGAGTGGDAGAIGLQGASGGDTLFAASNSGGAGSTINIGSGAGGSQTGGGTNPTTGGAGGNITISAASGGSVTSSAGTAGAAGAIALTAGNAGVGGAYDVNGGAVTLTSGNGNLAGTGGGLTLQAGIGGTDGIGGGVTIQAGAGGSVAGIGGAIGITGGAGTVAGYAGGAVTIAGGTGGNNNVAGGALNLQGGAAGASSTGIGTISGAVVLSTQNGGTGAGGFTGGAAGTLSIQGGNGGTGGATALGGAGSTININAGNGGANGAGSFWGGAGGAVNITAGYGVGAVRGGSIVLTAGSYNGSAGISTQNTGASLTLGSGDTTSSRNVILQGGNAKTDNGTLATTGSSGSNFNFILGAGGANTGGTSANIGGSAGSLNVTGATGGAISSVTAGATGGTGSSINLIAGAGGAETGAGAAATVGGIGGSITLTAANGGAVTSTGGIAGTAGNIGLTSGNAGIGGATNKNGGTLTLTTGNGNLAGTGGVLTLQGGSGGATGAGAALVLNSGNGGATSGNSGAITISVGTVTSGSAGDLTVGNSTDTNNVYIGNANTLTGKTQTIKIGAGTPAGTGKSDITIGAITASSNTTLIQGGNTATAIQFQTASGGTIGIGNNAVANTINIATANGANNATVAIGTGVTGGSNTAGVTIGSNNAAASTTLIQGGNGATAIRLQTSNAGSIVIGTTSQIGSITVGNSTDSNTINIGTGATASGKTLTIHIGDAGAAGSTTNITVGSAIAGTLTVKSAATFDKLVTFGGHVASANTSGTTTIAAGTAACTTPTVMTVTGNDTAGRISVTTGTGCAATGTLATVTFANAYGSAPRVIFTPTSATATALTYYNGAAGTATFTIDTNTIPTDATSYTYNYFVIQ